MAYFQVDKNPCKNLETSDDYFEWAKGCYREANAFYKVAIRNSDLLFGEEAMAVFTNIAFACELYFKCLLFINEINCAKKHDLFELYKLLPYEEKEKIKQRHPCTNIPKEQFELNLEELGKAFIVFRYIYERKEVAFNAQFLIELVETLKKNIHDKKLF